MSRKRNTPEERLSAVQDYLSGKRSAAQICQDLRVKNHQNIQEWVWLYQEHGEEAFVGKGHQRSQDAELRKLRKENERLKMEMEILKKAAAYFAKHPADE